MKSSARQRTGNEKRIKEHIDSNVFLEMFTEDAKFGTECTNVLGKFASTNPVYMGVFSTPVVGEIAQKIIFKLSDSREAVFNVLYKLCTERGIEVFTPTAKTFELINELKSMNSFLRPMDTLILACAIADRARIFITLDANFLNEDFQAEVKKKYGLLIKNASRV